MWIRLAFAASTAVIVAGCTAQPFEHHQITFRNNPNLVAAVDVDGDGDQDVVYQSEPDQRLYWFPNNGDGTFDLDRYISTDYVHAANDLEAADVDGDGDMDFLISALGDQCIWYFERDNVDEYWWMHQLSAYPGGTAVEYADMDSDGAKDVIGTTTSTLYWFRNTGPGVFATVEMLDYSIEYIRSLKVTDLDGDGDQDIVATATEQDSVMWKRNDGQMSFSPWMGIASIYDPVTVNCADMDGDGDMDVIAPPNYGTTAATFTCHFNDGAGNFTAGSTPPAEPPCNDPVALEPVDLDGDGDLDMVCAAPSYQRCTYAVNTGMGNFISVENLGALIDDVSYMRSCDLNGDGLGDMLYCALTADRIAWYENLGGTTAAPEITPEVPCMPAIHPTVLEDRASFRACDNLSAGELIPLRDLNGRVVRVLSGTGTNTVEVRRDGLPPGMYSIGTPTRFTRFIVP